MFVILVSLFYVCVSVTVSEEQPPFNLADYGINIDNKEGNLDLIRRLNTKRQRYPEFEEPKESSLESAGNKPCVDPRAVYDSLGSHNIPNRGAPDTLAQLKSVIAERGEKRRKPDPSIVQLHPNEQIKVSQSVLIEEASSAPGKIPMRVPPSAYPKTAEDYYENVENTYLPKTVKYEENILADPKDDSSEYIFTHNDAVPSHSGTHHSHLNSEIPNHSTSTIKISDKNVNDNKKNIHLHSHDHPADQPFYTFETLEPVTSENNPTEQPKQKLKKKPKSTSAPLNCELNQNTEKKEETESSEDSLPQSRRSLSPLGPKLETTSSLNEPTEKNTPSQVQKQVAAEKDSSPTEKEDDSNRYGYIPSAQLYSSNSIPIRNTNYLNPSPVVINGPGVNINGASYPLLDPTKGVGISSLSDPRMIMMETNKVCYACSSLTDPSCWFPQKTTTVKYCRPGHNVCVTKTYRSNPLAGVIVIRDCSSSCEMMTPGLNTKFESCAVCNEDLCNIIPVENSAFSINALNFMYILILTSSVKYAL